MANIGIVAGAGKLPVIFAQEAKARGDKTIGIGIKGITSADIESHVDKFVWFELGAFQKMVFALVSNRINKIVLLGKLKKDLFFDNAESFDDDTKKLLNKLNDNKDYSILNKAAEFMGKFGIEVIDPTVYLKGHVPSKGVITKRSPDKEESADIDYARKIAVELAGLDIGQTVIVKNRTVIAIEAVEGTDEAITRAGALSKRGFVVVKAARPKQDMRFDIPLVGLDTVEAIVKAGGTALAIEADKTLLIDRRAILDLADEKGLAITVV
ncbi:MAG: UDP-2,3-diacylglucosamine diphosphatase LpxI [Candidatus Omnitrophota bacterium]